MSGASIAAEAAQALSEVASDVGTGEFLVTLTQSTGGPATPWAGGTPTETDTELPAIISDFPQTMIDGSLIQQGDRRVMMAATGPKPSTADRLTVNGTTYRIISVREAGPSGIALYFWLQCRI